MKQQEIEQLTYEQAYAALEKIVTQLESDDQSLENLITLSEEGKALADHCASLLEKANLRVQKLDPAQTKAKGTEQ